MKNIFTSIKMFLILLLLPSYSLHAQAVTYPVNKPGIPDQPYFISYSDDAMAPFSDAAPSDNSPVAPAPRRSGIGDDLGNAGMGGDDEIDEGADASPIGAPWILLLLAVGYAAFKFYRKRGLVLETENESNTKNTTIMKNINDKIRSSFSTRIAALLLMLITMSVGQVWAWSHTFNAGEKIYYDLTGYGQNANIYNALGNEYGTWTGDIGGVSSIIEITLTNNLTITDQSGVFKSNASGWNAVKMSNEWSTGNNMIVSADGATATWGTYSAAPATEYTIYFKNTLGWTNVYAHFYTDSNPYGDNGCSGSGAAKNVDAQKIGSGPYYRITFQSSTAYTKVCFTKDEQNSYGNFWQTEASYTAGLDLSSANVLWIPSTPATETKNSNVPYYNSGTWTTYPESSPCDKTPAFTMQSNVNDAIKNVAKSISVTGTSNCASYQWSVTGLNASSASFSAETSATTNFTATVAGTYTVKMTATSDCGNTTEKTCTITVSDPAAQNITVYYSNPNNWEHVYYHAWGSGTGTQWSSCPEMTETVIINCQTYYKAVVDYSQVQNILFKNVTGDTSTKTSDQGLSEKDGKYYSTGGVWSVLPTTTNFSVTCASGTGYEISNLKVNGVSYTSGTSSLVCGDVVTFHVDATSGYTIASVKNGESTLDGIDGNYTLTTTGTEDITISVRIVQYYTATFGSISSCLGMGSVDVYTRTDSHSDDANEHWSNESLTSGEIGNLTEGMCYRFVPTPNAGCEFVGWYQDAAGENPFDEGYDANPYTFHEVEYDINVYAKFQNAFVYLNGTVASPEGTFNGTAKWGRDGIAMEWNGDYSIATKTITLNSESGDYTLNLYDGSSYSKGTTDISRASNSTTLTVADGGNSKVAADGAGAYTFTYTVSSNTLMVTYPALATHAVTFGVHSSGNGTLAAAVNSTAISSGDEVEQGRTVNFTATPSSGFEVAGWYSDSECNTLIDAAGTSTTYDATISAATSVYVKFRKIQYSVTYDACSSGHGSVAGSVASSSLQDPNTMVTLTATPEEGYYLRGWYSDAEGTNRIRYATKADEYKYTVTLDENKTVYAKFETIPTGLKLDGNLCGRSWGNCMEASTYSGGVYTWTWPSKTNANREFCIKNSTCNSEAVVKPNMENVTFDGTDCTIADGGDPNHNFKISHELGDLTVTLTYGSGIHVNATKASDELATGWYLVGSMNAWSNNNASYQFKLDPDHTDETIGYLTLRLNSNVDFKISNGTTQFANKNGENNSGTMTVDNCTNWTFDKTSVNGNHTTLRTNGEGDYTFVLNYTTKKVSVIYPNNRYIKSSWNNSWGTAAKMTYKAGTYTIQYKSVPASSNHQFVFCYADKGDMYHANASGVVMSNSTTTLSDDGSNHNFTFATTQTGDITITLTESGGTKDVRVAFSGKDISNLTVEVFHNYDGSNWTGKTLTKEGVNYVQTAHFYSTMYYQLRVDGATIVNQRASNLPGAGECIDGEDAKWVYNPQTEILSVQPIGGRHVIYFQNTVEWNDVFVYFYNGSYWNDTKGSGAQSGGNYLGVHQMTHVGDGLYSYTFTGTLPAVVCFAKVNQNTYENFDDNECAYAGAFAEAYNLYTPDPENPVRKNEHEEHYSLYYNGAWGTPTEYQVVVTMNNHIEYTSNKVMRTGKTVSFFAPQDGDDTYAGGTVELRANGVKVGDITGFAAAGVYVAAVNSTGDGLVDIAPYTGDYYVRSACVGGDGLMTFFERRATETYSYYKCLFTGDGKTVDVKATVANDYNENLSTMIGVDKFTTAEGKVKEGNVRYSYEPTTNDFRRAVIGGSTIGNKFLNVVGDHIYKEVGLTTLLNQAHYNTTPADSKFDDISDWVYEKTTYVNITNSEDASDVVVMSFFNNQTDYLLGYEKDPVTGYDTDNPRQLTVVGKNSTPGVYKIRIIYDYKRNRLLSAWSPDDITIDSNLQINADVMFVRHEDNDAAQINIEHGSDVTVSSLKSVMFVLEMEKDSKTSANYWLSLPYDCRISDIFGVDGYGTLWAIQRYDGETRSHGWYAHDTETFWTWMDRDEVLHAGEGYVLTFVKKNAHWSNVKIDGVDRSILRLYFPSQQVGFTMSEAEGSALTKTFEPMICDLIVKDKDGNEVAHGDRRAVDSNWRLIGPMSYNNIRIASYAASGEAEGHWYTTPPQFLYEYKGKSAEAHQRYSVRSTEGYVYHSFHSYMTQYAGTITWVPYTQAVSSSVAARRVESEGFTHTNMCLNLIQNDTVVLDRTYVSLDQHATNGYDQNLDLTKITDSKRSQIYSVSGDAYAGNTLPLETDTVALTINAAAAGDYVISLPEQNSDVEPMLYDAEMDMTTPLNLSNYTITLTKGTHANRFYLVLGRKTPGVATDLENVTTEELNLPIDRTQKLLINGDVYLLRDGYVYDATGRRVR